MAAASRGAIRALPFLNLRVIQYTPFGPATAPPFQLNSVLPSLLTAVLVPAFQLRLPQALSGLWDSVLKAVPKKKTSYRKKRQRFLAGKALKNVTELNKCSACGNVKKSHLLCPYCVREIRDMWLGKAKEKESQATKLEKEA